jgi:hypothetical protein
LAQNGELAVVVTGTPICKPHSIANALEIFKVGGGLPSSN